MQALHLAARPVLSNKALIHRPRLAVDAITDPAIRDRNRFAAEWFLIAGDELAGVIGRRPARKLLLQMAAALR